MLPRAHRRREHTEAFRWSARWIIAPLCVTGVMGALLVLTVLDIRAKVASMRGTSEDVALVSDTHASDTPQDTARPSLEEDRAVLLTRIDLSALEAARRLWMAGDAESVFQALDSADATEPLLIHLLALAASRPCERLTLLARRSLEPKVASLELQALCRSILKGEDPDAGER